MMKKANDCPLDRPGLDLIIYYEVWAYAHATFPSLFPTTLHLVLGLRELPFHSAVRFHQNETPRRRVAILHWRLRRSH